MPTSKKLKEAKEPREQLVKRTYRIPRRIGAKVDQLAVEQGMSRSSVITRAIEQYSLVDNKQTAPDEDVLEVLQLRTASLEKYCFHLLNLLNSLAANLDYETYESADSSPCSWLLESNREFHVVMTRRKTAKLLKHDKEKK